MSFGSEAVALARASVESEVLGGSVKIPSEGRFSEPSGAFVTLSEHPSGDLRGCIGYPLPSMPLGEAITRSARSACHDPRFPDLRPDELGGITVEVTALSVPHAIRSSSPEELASQVEIGRDGLVMELCGYRGLLLPQVPVEHGWDARTFLEHLSLKAGLFKDAWMDPRASIRSFTGEIWRETTPRGTTEEYHG